MKPFARASVFFSVLIFFLNLLIGCGGTTFQREGAAASATAEKKPESTIPSRKIITTTGMVTDIVRQVVGSYGQVSGLIEAGGDPHLFKPTRGDVKRLYEADIVFYSGLILEGRMSQTFEQLAHAGKPVFAVTERIDRADLRTFSGSPTHPDPHVWMEVAKWSECVQHVAESLAGLDPALALEYHRNAARYLLELNRLEEYTKASIASIPEKHRVLVTAHDAFGYFSQAYGIPVMSVQGISTVAEAGVLDVNRLVDFLVARKLPAIFVESSVNAKNIQAVIEGVASRGVTVRIGGELFSDAMGREGTYEGTYLGMIDHNATTITRALGGTAPAGGLHGKLSGHSLQNVPTEGVTE
ncbi:MAG: zinc ABC transporter substrate-binding protein [Planctomycetales bacterium]|jgi:manganese/zinc/iron transport system substrate-binding protein|nr:zinc ABC transporter substrate-binding protein [Planctomycetales bacterium]